MVPARPPFSLRDWTLERQTPAGPRTILRNIALDIHPGRWLAIIGANGCGKSSLLKYLASDASPVADKTAIMLQDPDEQIFATGVDREIRLGRVSVDADRVRREFALGDPGSMDPRLLSAGQKQRLALAVALGNEPEILLCDEPSSLQDADQAGWVLSRLDRWRHETGGALVTATCSRNEVSRADELLILRDGTVWRYGPVADLIGDPAVAALLGPVDGPASAATAKVHDDFEAGPLILELAGIGCEFANGGGFADLDLQIRGGERWGLVGANGSGKSTLLAACAGARRPDRGRVILSGRELYASGDLDLDHGQALLAPQFPEYMFTRSDVAAEIALDPVLAARAPGDFLAALGLPDGVVGRNPHDLSSGQRRRLALGLVLASERPLVLLDEPTAALDHAGREMVLQLLAAVPASSGLLIASHDRDFLARAGCRLLELTPVGLAAI